MKKSFIYNLLPCLVAMFMLTTFTACSDDDDNDTTLPIKESSFIGKWTREDITYRFNEDGTAVRTEEEYRDEYLWWVSDGVLYLKSNQYPDTNKYKVVSISSSRLIMQHMYYDEYGYERLGKEKTYIKQ